MKHSADPRIERLIALANTKNPDLVDAPMSGSLRTTRGSRQVPVRRYLDSPPSRTEVIVWIGVGTLGTLALWKWFLSRGTP